MDMGEARRGEGRGKGEGVEVQKRVGSVLYIYTLRGCFAHSTPVQVQIDQKKPGTPREFSKEFSFLPCPENVNAHNLA